MMNRRKRLTKAEALLLVEYEQDWLSATEAAAFEQNHLAHCAACRAELAALRPVWTALRAHPEILDAVEGERQRPRRDRRRYWS